MGISVIATDLQGRIIYWNVAAQRLFGYSAAETVGLPVTMIIGFSPTSDQAVSASLAPALADDTREFLATHRDGHTLLVEVTTRPVLDAANNPVAVVGVSTDISARRRGEQRLAHRVHHDPLTGLANRTLLAQRLEAALARVDRLNGQLVVLFLDVDRLKAVNDQFGHAAGDALLVELAHRLQAAVRAGDLLARYSGDEFIIVCDGLSALDTGKLSERIAAAMRPPFRIAGHLVRVALSLGVAVATRSDTVESVLRRADAAMYRAKHYGAAAAVGQTPAV